jgi:hypothetical protein
MKTNQTFFHICLCGALLLGLPATVEADFFYTTNSDGSTITITGYGGGTNVMVIPSSINGRTVTSIGDSAFFNNIGLMNLTNVVIPNSVTSIGDAAFLDMNVVSVTIPNSVTNISTDAFGNDFKLVHVAIPTNIVSIGDSSFQFCPMGIVTIPNSCISIGATVFYGCGATNVTIGNGLSSIGDEAFNGCTGLPAITVDASNPNYSSVGGVLFNKDQTTLIQYPGGRAGAYTMPNSVTTGGDNAFTYNSSLTSVTLSSSLTSIGYEMFYYCTSLGSVTIPNSVTNINILAFSECYSLANVTIGNGVTTIADEVFVDCSSLTNVTIGNGVTSIGNGAFASCNTLTGIYFHGNAPTPGFESFDGDAPGATVYYLAGTTGWGPTYGGLPTVMLGSQLLISNIGVKNNEFGFTIGGTSNQVAIVQVSTNLATQIWQPLQTNTLNGTTFNFIDSQWKNYPRRFYRLVAGP